MKISPYGTYPYRVQGNGGVADGSRTGKASGASREGVDFARGLGKALDRLNQVQNQADDMVAKLVTGQAEDIHSVILAVEKANLSLQMAVQVRNKVLEAYQEIMHMQV
ncbi:MAG: flagellar hook-basal body complex protein FliE [Actinobacteria bacterium]|nr:flagellar hook-basal body complex protein FliE [Actinomycetota bacterium]